MHVLMFLSSYVLPFLFYPINCSPVWLHIHSLQQEMLYELQKII
jgi:hypothetical protein